MGRLNPSTESPGVRPPISLRIAAASAIAAVQERDSIVADDMLVLRRAGLIEAEVDGELVALHVDNGTCYGFNATATRIWGMIEEPKRVSELRDALLEEYDVPPDVCEAELVDLLKDLEGDGLIELRAVAD
jgi:hypothetical protein